MAAAYQFYRFEMNEIRFHEVKIVSSFIKLNSIVFVYHIFHQNQVYLGCGTSVGEHGRGFLKNLSDFFVKYF